MDEIQTTIRNRTAEEAFARLERIFKELQENPVTHDTWDWMDAHFSLEVIRILHLRAVKEAKIEGLKEALDIASNWDEVAMEIERQITELEA
jgi:hypothetical protein